MCMCSPIHPPTDFLSHSIPLCRQYLNTEFEKADLGNDELISIDEFYMYFYSTLCFKFPVLRTGVNPGALPAATA
jgi:hypothetical protein